MISLHKILKQPQVVRSEEVVMIPDHVVSPSAFSAYNSTDAVDAQEQEANLIYDSIVNRAKEDAQMLSNSILQRASQQGEALMQKANLDAGQIREEAYQAGFAQGAQAKAEDITVSIRQIKELLKEFKTIQDQMQRQFETGVRDLSVEIAQKLIGQRMEQDPLALTELVHQALRTVKEANWITVKVSDQLPELVEYLEGELKSVPHRIDVQAGDFPLDTCQIHTESGMINASVSTQLRNLRSYFEELDQEEQSDR